jgi:hypothetical protein
MTKDEAIENSLGLFAGGRRTVAALAGCNSDPVVKHGIDGAGDQVAHAAAATPR